MNTQPNNTQQSEPAIGFAYAMGAFGIWGMFPLYLKMIDHIPAVEVVAHRVIWSIPVAGLIILLLGRTADLREAFKSPRTMLMASLCAGLISINWGVYVWAVAAERTVEGALGYYINPLFNVLLGTVFLGERLNKLQMAAIACAVIAVAILTVDAGGLPWISIVLPMTFGIYAYLRKTLPIGPTQGFMLEVLILAIPALVLMAWWSQSAQSHFGPTGWGDIMLLLCAGPITSIPLILYAFGAKKLRFTTIGILQYTAPTIIFLIAIFVFKEPFSFVSFIAFCFIWLGLALYTWSLFKKAK